MAVISLGRLPLSPEGRKLAERARRRRWLREAVQAVIYGLLIAGGVVLLILAGVAHAQGAAAGAGAGPAGISAAASSASSDLRAQEVNTGAAGSTVCPCALSGAPGACLTRDALRAVRDAATISLPSCRAQLGARLDELAAVRGALAASQAQAAALGAAGLDRQAAAGAIATAAKLTEQVSAPATGRAAPGWFERHAFGLGVAFGVTVGVGVALGIVYALLPARNSATGAATAALRPGRAPRFALVRW